MLGLEIFKMLDIVDKHSDQIGKEVSKLIIEAEASETKPKTTDIVGGSKETIVTVTLILDNDWSIEYEVEIDDDLVEVIIDEAVRQICGELACVDDSHYHIKEIVN